MWRKSGAWPCWIFCACLAATLFVPLTLQAKWATVLRLRPPPNVRTKPLAAMSYTLTFNISILNTLPQGFIVAHFACKVRATDMWRKSGAWPCWIFCTCLPAQHSSPSLCKQSELQCCASCLASLPILFFLDFKHPTPRLHKKPTLPMQIFAGTKRQNENSKRSPETKIRNK